MKYSDSLDLTFRALADPTRRGVLLLLVEGERTVGQLAESFELSPSGFSKHLRVLESAGLLQQRKRGRERYCRLDPRPLVEAVDWLSHHQRMWERVLGSFADYVAALKGGE